MEGELGELGWLDGSMMIVVIPFLIHCIFLFSGFNLLTAQSCPGKMGNRYLLFK